MIVVHWLTMTIIPFGIGSILIVFADKLDRNPRRQEFARWAGIWVIGFTLLLHFLSAISWTMMDWLLAVAIVGLVVFVVRWLRKEK
jgi:hypothetical protein